MPQFDKIHLGLNKHESQTPKSPFVWWSNFVILSKYVAYGFSWFHHSGVALDYLTTFLDTSWPSQAKTLNYHVTELLELYQQDKVRFTDFDKLKLVLLNYGSLVLGSSIFLHLSLRLQKMMIASKVTLKLSSRFVRLNPGYTLYLQPSAWSMGWRGKFNTEIIASSIGCRDVKKMLIIFGLWTFKTTVMINKK